MPQTRALHYERNSTADAGLYAPPLGPPGPPASSLKQGFDNRRGREDRLFSLSACRVHLLHFDDAAFDMSPQRKSHGLCPGEQRLGALVEREQQRALTS